MKGFPGQRELRQVGHCKVAFFQGRADDVIALSGR